MKNLHIIASPRAERSKSRMLWEFLVSKLDGETKTIDLSKVELPFLSEDLVTFNYWYKSYEDLSENDKNTSKIQNEFIRDIKSAENIIVSAPLWNFGVPAALKAYIDLIVKVNDTFTPEWGLVKNVKNLYVVLAKWWNYKGTAWESIETLQNNITQPFAYMWVTNAKVFTLEWVNYKTPQDLEKEIETLKQEITKSI